MEPIDEHVNADGYWESNFEREVQAVLEIVE